MYTAHFPHQPPFHAAMSEPQYQPAPNGRVVDAAATPDERTYATFMHLTLLLVHVVPVPVIAPLVMWLIKRDQSPFLDDHGKEAVNFHLSLLIYTIISGVLTIVLVGIVMLLAVYLLGLIGAIMAAVAANRGEVFRYPMTIRLIA